MKKQGVVSTSGILNGMVKANREVIEPLVKREIVSQQAEQSAGIERLATIGLLVAGVAHEINNPLNLIRINAELLSRYISNPDLLGNGGDSYSGDEFERAVSAILRGVDRIASIVRGINFFSCQRQGKKERVSLADCIQDAWQMVSLDKNLSRNVQFSVHVSPDQAVYADYRQLEQVLVNLLNNSLNAVHLAGREHGSITATVSENSLQGMLQIQVRDNGAGIEEAELSKVFEPFYTRNCGGTGLGLSVVQALVAKNDGCITVAGLPGGGTVFTILLPRYQAGKGDGYERTTGPAGTD